MTHLMNQVVTLTQQVQLATQTCPRATKVMVARPKPWNGKGGSVEAQHFLAAFSNYVGNEGDTLNDWEPLMNSWILNDERWIAAVLNLMEDEAYTWALPHPESLARRGVAFSNHYQYFVNAFTKRLPLSTPLKLCEMHLRLYNKAKAPWWSIFQNLTSSVSKLAGQMWTTAPGSMMASLMLSKITWPFQITLLPP